MDRRTAETTRWVKNYSPILVVPKDDKEVRPVLDGSSSGLNACLSPWGMSLPNFLHFALLVQPGMLLSKRDFRHGFH